MNRTATVFVIMVTTTFFACKPRQVEAEHGLLDDVSHTRPLGDVLDCRDEVRRFTVVLAKPSGASFLSVALDHDWRKPLLYEVQAENETSEAQIVSRASNAALVLEWDETRSIFHGIMDLGQAYAEPVLVDCFRIES